MVAENQRFFPAFSKEQRCRIDSHSARSPPLKRHRFDAWPPRARSLLGRRFEPCPLFLLRRAGSAPARCLDHKLVSRLHFDDDHWVERLDDTVSAPCSDTSFTGPATRCCVSRRFSTFQARRCQRKQICHLRDGA